MLSNNLVITSQPHPSNMLTDYSSMFRFMIIILLSFFVYGDVTDNEVILPDALHQLEIVNGTDADEGEFPFAVR